MLELTHIDALTEYVVARLLVDGDSARAAAHDLARDLAATHPHVPALSLALPFALAAGAIDEMLGAGAEAHAAAADAWRIAALIGVETLALQAQDPARARIVDLWAHWARGDAVFTAG